MRLAYSLMLCMILLLMSCERKDLTYDYYPYCDVKFNVDWSEFNNVEKPKGMSIWVYPKNGDNVLKYQTNDIEKMLIPLREGTYDIVVFNRTPSGFGSLGFRGENNLSTLEIYSLPQTESGWYTKANDGIIAKEVENIAFSVYKDYKVSSQMKQKSDNSRLKTSQSNDDIINEVNLTPKSILKQFKIKLLIDGIHNLRSARAVFSGMAEGYKVELKACTSQSIAYPITKWTKKGSYGNGELYLLCDGFGLINKSSDTESLPIGLLHIELLLVDNSTVVKYEFPIVYSMINENGNEITIDIRNYQTINNKEIVLPDVKPSESGGENGFGAEISDWEKSEETDVIL